MAAPTSTCCASASSPRHKPGERGYLILSYNWCIESAEEPEHSLLGLSAAGFHRIAYTLWGGRGPSETTAQTIVCVHGLARNGRDFDVLAGFLAAHGARVACPDV